MADNVALLIDWENIKASSTELLHSPPDIVTLKKIARRYGTLMFGRAYANWDEGWHTGDSSRLARQGIEPVFAPTRMLRGAPVKDLSDFYLACDAVELVFTHPEIKCFVVVSGDGALDVAISKLCAHGKGTVRVAVRGSMSKFQVSLSTERIFYDDWVQWMKPSGSKIGGALAAFRLAVRELERPDSAPTLPAVKARMQERDPKFEEENLGIGTFRHLAYLAEAKGFVSVDATHGEPASVRTVLKEGLADLRYPDKSKWTALINAVEEGAEYNDEGLTELLVKKQIVPNTAAARSLIDTARHSDVLWQKPAKFFEAGGPGVVKKMQYVLNTHHPRVQVARSLRPRAA